MPPYKYGIATWILNSDSQIRGYRLCADRGLPVSVDRPHAMGGHEHHDAAEQADQIVVVLIESFFQQEYVSEAKSKNGSADSIKAPGQNANGRQPHDTKMDVHALTQATASPS